MGKHWDEGRRVARRFGRRWGCCPIAPVVGFFSWLFSSHLERRRPKESDDGHEHLVFLAGLVLTYGIALTLTEQGKGVRWFAIAIFSVVSILTIAGIWLLLRCVDDGPNPEETPRAFTPSTIRFGEWAITFSIVVFVGFFAFAAFGILPGQGGRVEYKPGTLPTSTSHWNQNPIAGSNLSNTSSKSARAEHERQAMFEHTGDQLNREVQQENSTLEPKGSSRKKVFLVEQDEPFDEDYHAFELRFSVKRDYEVVDAFGVLISSNPPWAKMRPVHFPRQEHGEPNILGVFMLENPEKGETLRMAVVVQTRDATKRFPTQDFRPEDIGLILRKEGD